MEQPLHTIRAQQTSWLAPNRLIALGAATVIVVGFAWALSIGLAQTLVEKLPEVLKAEVVQEKLPDKPPPPPPPQLKEPPPPFVPPPDITIQTESPATTAISSQSKVATPVAAPPPTDLRAIARTHTLPPYPDVAKRLGEQGTTTMRVTISTDGDVTACSIEKSSGSERLDSAACAYVQEHWRWQPPTQSGHPTSAVTLVAVKWDLKNQ